MKNNSLCCLYHWKAETLRWNPNKTSQQDTKIIQDQERQLDFTAYFLINLNKLDNTFTYRYTLMFCYFTSSSAEKEKSKYQSEVYELVSQVESFNKEKILNIKHVEKLEVQISELHIKIEELNRTIIDITSHKSRLHHENIELTKSVQDLKLSIESISYSKTQIISQLEDARRRLEDDERRRSSLESSLHSVEVELDSVRLQLEEESEARLDLERQLVKVNGEAQQWHARFDAEAAARTEENEELRRKYTIRIQEQEEHIETLLVKITSLEKFKSKLSSEVEILIIDLEKANGQTRELYKRVEVLERTSLELRSRLEETVTLYEVSQRDLKNKQVELVRITNELDSTKGQRDQLARDNQKLAGECTLRF